MFDTSLRGAQSSSALFSPRALLGQGLNAAFSDVVQALPISSSALAVA